MTGRNSFSKLAGELSPERRAHVEEKKAALRKEMSLAELRAARQMTQETIGEILNVGQPSVAKLERRADMYLSTLRKYVKATGGNLEIVARYPDGDVRITHLAEIDERPPAKERADDPELLRA